jgi:hypothetical protein
MLQSERSFVGIEGLLKRHRDQLAAFEKWAQAGQWDTLHRHHYDWWMFPINEKSSHGFRYTLSKENVEELKSQPDFIRNLKRGVELLMLAWGWDIHRQALIDNPAPAQSWHSWPVRLYKAGRCMQLFGEEEYFQSMLKYAHYLRDQLKCNLEFMSSALNKKVHLLEQWDEPLWPEEDENATNFPHTKNQ